MELIPIKVQLNEWILIKSLLSTLPKYCEVRAFGSRVNGSPKPFSDLDLALVADNAIPIDVMAELNEAFVKSDLPFKVDLIDWQLISPEFKNIISQNCITIK